MEKIEIILMPKLIGLTPKEAKNRLALLDIKAELFGRGRVIWQYPKPGDCVCRACILECRIAPEVSLQ